jgi:flagellar hook-length control protein FliK
MKESVLSQVRHAEPIHDGKGASTISLKLNPEDLGELTINVRVEDQRLKVEVVSENRSVRDALMNNMESLKETLLKQHFTMERFDVSTGANSNGSNQAFTGDSGEQRNNAPRQFNRKGELADLPEPKQVTSDRDGEESLLNVRA